MIDQRFRRHFGQTFNSGVIPDQMRLPSPILADTMATYSQLIS
jgi:hypothetical protein